MIYILHGPDELTRTEYLAGLRSGQDDPSLGDLNTTELAGATLTLSELQHHSDAIPFLSNRRKVIVYQYLSRLAGRGKARPDQAATEALAEYLSRIPPTTDLIFVEDRLLQPSFPILKLAHGLNAEGVKSFGGPRPEDLPRWIAQRVRQKGASIERPAAVALANVVGDDLRALDNELQKLALYVNGERPITQADVKLLAAYVAGAENFGLANAIGRGDARKALDQMHRLLQDGASPLGILASIVGQLRGLLEVKDMAERGMSPAAIASHKGWRSDYAAKMRLKEAGRFSMARLQQSLEMLLETDLAIKTGRLEPLLALDTVLVELCAQT
jgi:DNA polymerase III subunit delta